MMSPSEIRLKQSPVLSSLLLGMGQGSFIAERVFPRLPQALSGVTLAQLGDERFRKYNLRRAPGTPTKRVSIKYEGKVYTVNESAVEIPIPRELIREADESRKLNVSNHLDISRIAVMTAHDILLMDYELDAAALATNPASYASGHVVDLAGVTKWGTDTGTPVSDIEAAGNLIRKKTGRRPNQLTLSADAFTAIRRSLDIQSYLPDSQLGRASIEDLKRILQLDEVQVGDAVWKDETDTTRDVWGNNAVLSYAPQVSANGEADISLAAPAFGFTSVIEGHPYMEPPYYSPGEKSWMFGATYERQANIAFDTAAVLFRNPL
ncbi:MAG: hypothetical protein JSR83_10130 [Proteobacteria bacterium]|nr:hypothetical protein [Pseudomonadota bacterium]